MDKLLLKNLNNTQAKRAPEFDDTICPGTKVKAYKVEGETSICKIWNSSNNESFNTERACREIINKLMEDDNVVEGNVGIGFYEIMFEIIEK